MAVDIRILEAGDAAILANVADDVFDAALDEASSLRRLEFEPRWHYVSEYQPSDGGDAGRRVTCFLPDRVDLQRCDAQLSELALP